MQENTKHSEDGAAVCSSDLLCAATIMQGLLASGHYTYKMGADGDDMPKVCLRDNGKRWEEYGFDDQFEPCVVSEAIWLLRELKQRLEQDL